VTIVDHDGSDLVSGPERDTVGVDRRADGEPPRWVRAALVVVVLLPILVAIVRALVNDWFPVGDSALLYIRARDVATAHHPLLGSWTSASLSVGEQMNNPGPLYDDLLAPIARTLPFSSAAAIAVGAVNAAYVLAISGVSRAVGGWAMQRWMLLACAAMSWVLGSELLIDIWQAHALLLPFLLYLVLMIGLACGEARWIPFAAGVASVLVQTHISYVFVLAAATAAALAVCAVRSWPPRDWAWRQALRSRTAAWTAVVVVVCWAQPIWEQLFGRGKGNLARLMSNASGGDVQLGPALGVRLSGNVLPQPLWQLRRGFSSLVPRAATVEGDDGPFIDVVSPLIGGPAALVLWLALVVVLAALGWTLHRRHVRIAAAACWVTTGVVLAAPACLSIVTVGRLFAPHHVRWLWTVAVLVNVVVLWALAELVAFRWRRAAAAVAIAPIALAIVLSVAALPFHAQQQGPVADYEAMPALRRVFRELEPLRAAEPVVYDTSLNRVFEPYSSAVMMRLQELGIDFRVTDEGWIRQLGERRRAAGTETTRIFQLEHAAALDYDGPACRVTIASALDPAEEAVTREHLDDLALAIAIGEVTVDLDAVDQALREAAQLAASGDAALARRLIMDGALDAESLAGDAALIDTLDVIQGWVGSTYALFAEGLPGCPPRA
jgi:hypothetical protein